MSSSAVVSAPTGLLVVDKEPGWTSHDVVARVRSLFGQRRAGHAGTLDPDATGVLLVGLGRVTRVLRFLTALGKEYTAEIVLGVATDTLDASGAVVGEWDMSGVTLEEARAAAAGLTGVVQQVPPMVSAVKVGGRRLHELARRGIDVERPVRTVRVERFDLEPTDAPGVLRATVACSSGTYVRSLADDLGSSLGGGAHVRLLRRTRVGSFTVEEAKPVGALDASSLRSPAEALRDLDRVAVDHDIARAVARGRPLDKVPIGATGDGPWAILDETGRLLAVYEQTAGHRIRPAVVLASR
ncbi:MAG: tRNA pseudouridine(55) synthase TruB [Actinomycetota bacterium]|nr:tRNA pseudouridine(55) synthase TruB [Actinomycetota bacterium]